MSTGPAGLARATGPPHTSAWSAPRDRPGDAGRGTTRSLRERLVGQAGRPPRLRSDSRVAVGPGGPPGGAAGPAGRPRPRELPVGFEPTTSSLPRTRSTD